MVCSTSQFQLPDVIKAVPFELKMNPYYDEARDASNAYFDLHSVHETEKDRDTFLRAKFSLLASLAFPNCGPDTLRNCCDYLGWVFVFDDHADNGEFRKDRDGAKRLAKIITDILEDPHTYKAEVPFAEIFRSFWERTLTTAGLGCRERFVRTTIEYLEDMCRQVEHRSTCTLPTLEEYIELRRNTSGVKPCWALVEYANNIDLPSDVASHPVLKSLDAGACDLLAWANDLYSFNLEQSWGETHNLVCVVMREKELDLQGAMDYCGGMMRRRYAEYQGEKERLPSWGEEVDGVVRRYLKGLEHWVIGVINWSFMSERYFGKEGLEVRRTRVATLYPRNYAIPKDSLREE
ncbi:hypothetical protein HDV00_009658 [Rhizophlyctis rosea]|nr:hypothetical protein HDV00_009658 [Rhizophlyctis rosea]